MPVEALIKSSFLKCCTLTEQTLSLTMRKYVILFIIIIIGIIIITNTRVCVLFKKYFGLAPGKWVHLKYAFDIRCDEVKTSRAQAANDDVMIEVHATVDMKNTHKCKGKKERKRGYLVSLISSGF